MYTNKFTDTTTEKITEAIKEKGYFVCENVMTDQYIEMLLQEVDFDQVLVNANDVGVVFSNTQKYLTHCLAKSKKTYDVITSSKVLDICKKYFSNRFMLVNHRIFQTQRFHHMPWHTDNNLQSGSKLVGKHDMSGLLFIFYLSDVTKNATQYIKNSHEWSSKYNDEICLSDQLISSNYNKDIVTFPMPKGSLVICNTHGIHRAEPFKDVNYIRTTLIFQVDEIGDNNQSTGHGERSLVNIEYMDNLNSEIIEYLGLGCKRNYPIFPLTSVSTMTPGEIINLQRELLPLMLKALLKRVILSLLPPKAVVSIKRIVWYVKRQFL